MFTGKLIFQLALVVAAWAAPLELRQTGNSTSKAINWGPCPFNGSLPILCGILAVPLDYAEVGSDHTLDLNLVKVPAVNTPSRGSILFNFGGPGYEAIQSLASLASYLQNTTGGYHDLIAFDPRGTGVALAYSCFNDTVERNIATYQYPLPPADSSETALGQAWASSKVLANFCLAKTRDIAELIGTAYVARDLMQVVDELDEDGLLRYWGFSYGSLLGETVAAMFPDRMDKVLLDGVVNGHNYYHKTGMWVSTLSTWTNRVLKLTRTSDTDQLLSADDTFSAVLAECVKAGSRCALSQLNSTALELQTTLWNLAEDLRVSPIAIGTTIIDYNFILNLYYLSIKEPILFPSAAWLILDVLTQQNLETVVDFYQRLAGGIALGNPEAIFGILGGDKFPRYSDLADVLPDIDYMAQTSTKFWGLTGSYSAITAQWPFEAKERYTGDFKVKTRNPVLFVGNTWDPATSVASAKNMSVSFEGSVMFEQHGFGHTTLAQSSACTSKIIRDYFTEGSLPAPDTLCEVETSLFP